MLAQFIHFLFHVVNVCLQVHRLLITDTANSIGLAGMILFDTRINKWRAVFVDNQYMCTDEDQLAFSKSSSENELWPSLIEKCYVKFVGGVQNTGNCTLPECLRMLTGGDTVTMRLGDKRDVFQMGVLETFTKIESFFLRGYLLCLEIPERAGEKPVMGLVSGCAYTVVRVVQAGKNCLLQLCSPLAGSEWTGAWSDQSRNWTKRLQEVFGENKEDNDDIGKIDGKFWMSIQDVCEHFRLLHVCRVFPYVINKSSGEDRSKLQTFPKNTDVLAPEVPIWFSHDFNGRWANLTAQGQISVVNERAGSDFTYLPQYLFRHDGFPSGRLICSVSVDLEVTFDIENHHEIFGLEVVAPGKKGARDLVQIAPVTGREQLALVFSKPSMRTLCVELSLYLGNNYVFIPFLAHRSAIANFTLKFKSASDFTVKLLNPVAGSTSDEMELLLS
jgi:hypothetical protein